MSKPIIKEYVATGNGNAKVIIRTNSYDKRASYIMFLVDIAKTDFDEIDADDIEIIVYGGSSYKGTYGIEFNIAHPHHALKDYTQVKSVEFALA